MDLPTILQLLKQNPNVGPNGGNPFTTPGGPPQPQGNFSMGQMPGGGAGATQGLLPPAQMPQPPAQMPSGDPTDFGSGYYR